MNVCLIDVDSKIPNLALMKASTWHKQRGDTVKLGYDPLFDHPDLCYVSKMFNFTPEPEYLPDCEIVRGGPAYSLTARMPFDDGVTYNRIMPDYGLYAAKYPKANYAIGRFTRGCPNRCPWCVVWRMDGNHVRHVADLADFWCGQPVVRLLDDNIMADEDEFVDDCRQLHDAGVRVIWEALDIRLVNDRIASALASVKPEKSIHFAWDGPAQDDYVRGGVDTLRRNGVKPYRLMFYVLVGFNTTPEYDMHRIMTLHELGVNPFVMPYFDDGVKSEYAKHLARWCNNKFIFKSTDFDHYEPWVKAREAGATCEPAHRPVDVHLRQPDRED